MSRAAKEHAMAFAAGLLFGIGLVVSGMTRPEKVIGFLDVSGRWDASLAFVMLGAIAVHFFAYRAIARRPSPLLATNWSTPSRRDLDAKLVLGAAVFGVGWGLAGYCPGPAVVSLSSGALGVLIFAATMVLGMLVTGAVTRVTKSAASPAHRRSGSTS